jgi:hypothetical protein
MEKAETLAWKRVKAVGDEDAAIKRMVRSLLRS